MLPSLPVADGSVLCEDNPASGADVHTGQHGVWSCTPCCDFVIASQEEVLEDDEDDALDYARYEFGVLDEDEEPYLQGDLVPYTCTGCGAYSTTGGAEHPCWRNEDGSYEVGGSFQ